MSDIMTVNAGDALLVKEQLWDDEVVEETVRQRRIGPGGSLTTPTSVVCTNKRVFIVNKATFGLRKDYEVIQYRQITSVRFESGIFSSAVFIRVQGYDRSKGLLSMGKEEGQIDGLHHRDAKGLADYLNKKIAMVEEHISKGEQHGQTDNADMNAYALCPKCGHKHGPGTKFCDNCGARLL